MKKLFLFCIFIGTLLILPWLLISFTTRGLVYENISDVPARKYGLLLGTSPWANGKNPFFLTRIEATRMLYEQGKIEYIVVSGDNSTAAYNEPAYMRRALLAAGIPENAIVMDFAGFRTLDSVLRAKEVFSLTDDITIISQPFHLERALFIAKLHKINAIGYGAADVNLNYGLQTYIREIGARWLALYDAATGREATILWEKIDIEKEKTTENPAENTPENSENTEISENADENIAENSKNQ